MQACYFHGTYWQYEQQLDQAETCTFFELDTGYSDYEVAYVSNSEEVAVYFSKRCNIFENSIPVILRGELLTSNILECLSYDLGRSGMIEVDGISYDIADRDALYEGLRAKYDGLNIKGNYDGKGDDIAIFNGNDFLVGSIKLCIDGQWTDWLDRDQAVEAFYAHFGASAPSP